jgi:arginine-tRNA-protein transferase
MKLNFDLDFKTATHFEVLPAEMDRLWADGWRNFGEYFFRNRVDYHSTLQCWVKVLPLRINVEKFQLSKHQKRLLKKHKTTEVRYQPIQIDAERKEMFLKHINRFKSNLPDSLETFLGDKAGVVPCLALECALYDEKNKLYACSFFGVGEEAISSIYATFDTDFEDYSPGLHTLLAEVQYAQTHHKKYVYLGYSYREPSHYDYKKNFYGLECYDWKGNWRDFERETHF